MQDRVLKMQLELHKLYEMELYFWYNSSVGFSL